MNADAAACTVLYLHAVGNGYEAWRSWIGVVLCKAYKLALQRGNTVYQRSLLAALAEWLRPDEVMRKAGSAELLAALDGVPVPVRRGGYPLGEVIAEALALIMGVTVVLLMDTSSLVAGAPPHVQVRG